MITQRSFLILKNNFCNIERMNGTRNIRTTAIDHLNKLTLVNISK